MKKKRTYVPPCLRCYPMEPQLMGFTASISSRNRYDLEDMVDSDANGRDRYGGDNMTDLNYGGRFGYGGESMVEPGSGGRPAYDGSDTDSDWSF